MASQDTPTSDRLRHDIDSGKTGDKVDFPDPAAAPLGTDDEAGGRPPSEAERALAARVGPRAEEPARERGRAAAPAFVAFAAAALVVLAIAWRVLGGS